MKSKLFMRVVSVLLTITIVVGIIPVRIVKADTTTGQSETISVNYQEQSSWGDFTQAQIDVTNTSGKAIDEWIVALTFDSPVLVSSIWNAVLCETDISSENTLYITNESYNGHIEAGNTVSFGLITQSESGLPTVGVVESNDELPSDDETELFSYAVFTSNDFNFSGWKSNVVGSFYTGNKFNYQGSEIYLYGNLDVVNEYVCNGWKTEIGEINENCDSLEMPDFDECIYSLREDLDEIDSGSLTSADSIVANGFYYIDGDITIEGTTFEGDCVIVATGNITYNVDSLSGSGRVVLYSTNGNITINGSEIVVNGILYAPNGDVNINAYDTTFNGRIIAENVNYQGSVLNVTASGSDLELIYKYPDVDITVSSSEVFQGEEAYFEVELKDDEETPYSVKYRLNGEEVEIDETLVYVLDTSLLGAYTLEAYIETSVGEKLLDKETIVVKTVVTPEPTATNTPVPTATSTPTPTSTPVPTATSTPTPTSTPVPTATSTPTPTSTPVPTATSTPTPTSTPVPTAIPTEEPVEYRVISEGNPVYGYINLFTEENWNCGNDAIFDPYCIEVCPNITWMNGYAFFMTSRVFDNDLSFDARFTTRIDYTGSHADGIAFVICPRIMNDNTNGGSIGYRGIDPSVVVEIDNWSNGGKHRNELGEGDWLLGESPKHIAITLNGDTTVHYAYADYEPIRTSGTINEVWVNYDGKNKVMYVYMATYDSEGNIEKPTAPILVLNIDLEEHFAGVNDLYMGFTSSTGIASASHKLLGFELDPMPALHGDGTIQIMSQIGEVVVGEPIVINGKINGSDGKVQLFDAADNEIYSEFLQPSGNYEKLTEISTDELGVGDYYVVISATDSEGEEKVQTIYVKLIDERIPTPIPGDSDFTDEELKISFADNQDGEEITYISDIVGTVSGTLLSRYTFEVIPANTESAVYSSSGTEAVIDASLGIVDATRLLNGYYTVRVTAYTEDDMRISEEITVLVSGLAKIGMQSFTFLDMTTGLNNFPIEIYRTYNSLDLNEEGDFGYGWNMKIAAPSISVSSNLGADWLQNHYIGLVGIPVYYWEEGKIHEVTVDWGNGKTETFKLKLDPAEQYMAFSNDISAYFEAKDNVTSTLEILDMHTELVYDDGILYSRDFMNQFNPQNFLLTTRDGTKYYFNVDTGLYKVEDTYGRTIEINNDGIFYSDGSGITINRDAADRIISITDGLQTVQYSYDDNGDLVSVVERTGDTVSYSYDNHYINDIVDSRGVHAVRNEYDENGRIVATIDANGNRIEFDYDLSANTQVVTDRLNNPTIYVYDDFGNIISETDALGRTTTRTFDANSNMTSETDPMGNTTYYNYSASGDLISMTDANGVARENTYSTKGELITMAHAGIVDIELYYNERGYLTSAKDSLGNTHSYTYSESGDLNSISDSIGSIVNFTYDSDGNIVSSVTADGREVKFSTDSFGRIISRSTLYNGTTLTDYFSYDVYDNLITISYADGMRETFTYDLMGNCTSVTDSLGKTTSYGYDIYGNLTLISYPDGTSESFTYDIEGHQLSSTDRLGRTNKYTYDAVGNMLTSSYATGAIVTYTYDDCNRIISVANSVSGTTTYTYDAMGNVLKIIDDLGNATSYSYNSLGLVSSVTDANGNKYSFGYDVAGNQTSITCPNGAVYSFDYDVRSRLISESDAVGNTTTYSYDVLDRLTSVEDASGARWIYKYDSLGNIVSVVDPNGNETKYSYDEYGRIVSTTNALGNAFTISYDDYGQIVRRTDFAGNITTYTYDSMGRLSSETHEEGTIRYFYNSIGELIKVQDISGEIYYTYSSEGYIESKTDSNGNVVSYTYDELGHITSIISNMNVTSYKYDTLGRVVEVIDQDGNNTSYTYDRVGNLVETKYSNGVTTSYTYNEVNILVSQITTNEKNEIISSYVYTLGTNGERLKVDELSRTIEYTYDSCERLIGEKITRADGSTTEYTYEYDLNSNRISKTVNGEVITYRYNAINQLVSEGDVEYIYDDAGNLVTVRRGDTLLASYEYDSRNNMISSSTYGVEGIITVDYTYNYMDNRISKSVEGKTTTYTLDYSTGLAQVLIENVDGDEIYYVRGHQLISREEKGLTYFYIYDGGLNVRALTDITGAVTDKYAFDSFGAQLSHDGDSDNCYGFKGEIFDAETGLYYLRARYMSPTTGTFTSMDTYINDLYVPMSQNRYMYANSNPVKYGDPTGNFTILEQQICNQIIVAYCDIEMSFAKTMLESELKLLQGGSPADCVKSITLDFTYDTLTGVLKGLVTSLFTSFSPKVWFIALALNVIDSSETIYDEGKNILSGEQNACENVLSFVKMVDASKTIKSSANEFMDLGVLCVKAEFKSKLGVAYIKLEFDIDKRE